MQDSSGFAGRRILILGGLGFIGSNLAIRLVELGADVTLVDSMLPKYGGNLENISPIIDKCRVNYSDVRDRHSLEYLVRDTEIIYNMAGQTSHVESMTDPFTDLEINCSSQLALLESCRAENPDVQIVFASTRQLYGRPQYVPVDEAHPTEPADVNGVHKLAAEKYYSVYSNVYGIPSVSLRLTNTYGPRQQLRGNKQGFLGIFVRLALQGEKISVFGDGLQLRDFNYVDDVVDACLLAADRPELHGGVFNLGSDENHSLNDVVAILQQHCDFPHELVPFPDDHQRIDIGDYYADSSLFRSLTGWSPAISLSDGLRNTIEYFRPRIHSYV